MMKRKVDIISQIGELLTKSGVKELDAEKLPQRMRGRWFYIFKHWGLNYQFKFEPPTMLNFGINNIWDQIDYDPQKRKVIVFHGHFTAPGMKIEKCSCGGTLFHDSFAKTSYPCDTKRIVRRILSLLRKKEK